MTNPPSLYDDAGGNRPPPPKKPTQWRTRLLPIISRRGPGDPRFANSRRVWGCDAYQEITYIGRPQDIVMDAIYRDWRKSVRIWELRLERARRRRGFDVDGWLASNPCPVRPCPCAEKRMDHPRRALRPVPIKCRCSASSKRKPDPKPDPPKSVSTRKTSTVAETPAKRRGRPSENADRDKALVAKYQEGSCYRDLARIFKISKGRVGQIIRQAHASGMDLFRGV